MITLHHADALDVLRALPDSSVDAIVTDPPYGLAELRTDHVTAAIAAWVTGDRERVPDGRGFMGRGWDAFVPPPAVWDECLRVLRPGGWLAAFAGARTVDLMGLSVRLAGFTVHDGLQWLYGSGMPKGLDVGKAIDKAAGATREIVGPDRGRLIGGRNGASTNHGRGGVAYGLDAETAPATDAARTWHGWNTQLKPAHESIVLARKPLAGTVAANVLAHGTGALNVDACRVGAGGHLRWSAPRGAGRWEGGTFGDTDGAVATSNEQGRHPANVLLDEHAAAWLDEQSGTLKSGANPTRRGSDKVRDTYGEFAGQAECTPRRGADEGGASRFFPTFHYSAKAPKGERPLVWGPHASCRCTGPIARPIDPETGALPPWWRQGSECAACSRPAVLRGHPTVKPQSVATWLLRLLVRPGGTFVDPFAGSGAFGQAGAALGLDGVLVERDEHSVVLCEQRLDVHRTPLPVVPGPLAEVTPIVVAEVLDEVAACAPPTLLDLIAQAPDDAACRALYGQHADEWTPDHTAAVRDRLGELAGRAA